MPLNTVYKVMSSIERQWNILESYLYYPTKVHEFDGYLNSYRGQATAHSVFSFNRTQAAEEAAQGLMNFFVNIFAMEGLAELTVNYIEFVLNEVEKRVNLSFYYWFGLNDRNYQFRTWIHFFGLQGLGGVFLTKDKHNFSLTLCESGICLGLESQHRLPQILSFSRVLVYQGSEFFHSVNEREIFARIRTIQREICLYIDEWEYQNSILAVEYGQSLHIVKNNPSNKAEENHSFILKMMDTKRNFYAGLGLEALCDFQEWANLISKSSSNSDIISEIDALCALILSSLQKFFLPASISRLVYEQQIISLCQRMMIARLEYCPEDYSAKLVLQCTQSALGGNFNLQLFDILNLKPFEWKLCFDPSSALKAFCWAYSKKHHTLLVTLMGLSFFKKSYSNHMEEFQLSDLVSAFQIQDIFLAFLKKEPLHENPLPHNNLIEQPISLLIKTFNSYLQTHVRKSKYSDESLEIIIAYMGNLT